MIFASSHVICGLDSRYPMSKDQHQQNYNDMVAATKLFGGIEKPLSKSPFV